MRTPNEIFDELLVLRCQGGDSGAFTLLVERWHPRMLRLATRLLGDRTEAEDAVQSSWEVAVRKIDSLRDAAAFRSWVFRVVANKCADRIRQRQASRSREVPICPDSLADEAARDVGNDGLATLRHGIQSLDQNKQTVLRLHYLEGMSVEQIASRESLPVGTVKSRLHHARNQLRIILKENDNE